MNIVVTVGTIEYPFERMTRAVTLLHQLYPRLCFYIQFGHTLGLKGIEGVSGVSFVEQKILRQEMREADIVLIHGGEGSILDSLEMCSHPPIIFPRDPKFGEHVDRYQIEVSKAVSRRGLGMYGLTVTEIVALVQVEIEKQPRQQRFPISKKIKGVLQNSALINSLNVLCK